MIAARDALRLAPVGLVLGGLFLGGLALAFVQALGYVPSLGLTEPTLAYFGRVLGDDEFVQGFLLTFRVAALSAVLSTALGAGLALLLAPLAGQAPRLQFLLRAPLSLPHMVVAAMVLVVLSPSGIVARLGHALDLVPDPEAFPALVQDPFGWGMIIAYALKEIPFVTVLTLPLITAGTQRLADAARTLGANRWQIARHVVWPVVWPGVAGAATILFAYTFAAFEVPFVLGRTYPKMLPVLAYQKFLGINPGDRPVAMAAGIVIAAVTLLVALVYVRLLAFHDARFKLVREGSND